MQKEEKVGEENQVTLEKRVEGRSGGVKGRGVGDRVTDS